MLISDLVPEEADLARIEARLRSINTFAPIVRTTRSEISVESVLNLKAFDLEKTLERDSEFLDTDAEHVHEEEPHHQLEYDGLADGVPCQGGDHLPIARRNLGLETELLALGNEEQRLPHVVQGRCDEDERRVNPKVVGL